jgi:carotenoid cleavage dioxygenase-like enzyme
VRNGGNPVTNAELGRDYHWFDGDGMLAGVSFWRSSSNPEEAIPHFVNQYILTDLYISSLEHKTLRTPILPSIATLVSPFSNPIVVVYRILRAVFLVFLTHVFGSQQVVKRISVANTAIYHHDGRVLATCESGPPIRIQLPGLETVGWYNGVQAEGEAQPETESHIQEEKLGGTGLLSWMREWTTGHPKIDPQTGEMVLFNCSFAAPYVHVSVIPPAPTLTSDASSSRLMNAPVPGCSGGKMMHDFGASAKHTIILDLPLSLSPANLMVNQPALLYDVNKPARFAVFPRHRPDQVRWFETAACCIFHTANTWDECDSTGTATAVNLLACRLTSASPVFSAGNIIPPSQSKQQKSSQRKRMSFFARYDEDEAADVEKTKNNEKIPLLTANDATLEESSKSVPPVSEDDNEQCRLYYYRFPLTSSAPTISHQYALSAIPFEFPALNPANEMATARYIYGCSTSNEQFGAALGKAAKVDVLVKIDVRTLMSRAERTPPRNITGCVDTRNLEQVLDSQDDNDAVRAFKMPPNWYAQEMRFVSRDNPTSEDDGYLLFYAFDETQLDEFGDCPPSSVSELWIVDAKNFRDVVAKIRLPQRVPYGLHGNWFTEQQIAEQRAVESVRQMPGERSGMLKAVQDRIISVSR